MPIHLKIDPKYRPDFYEGGNIDYCPLLLSINLENKSLNVNKMGFPLKYVWYFYPNSPYDLEFIKKLEEINEILSLKNFTFWEIPINGVLRLATINKVIKVKIEETADRILKNKNYHDIPKIEPMRGIFIYENFPEFPDGLYPEIMSLIEYRMNHESFNKQI